ncbi:MAG: hypothetical protein V1694_12595 [Candidatus Eisenbacteria bacterium]
MKKPFVVIILLLLLAYVPTAYCKEPATHNYRFEDEVTFAKGNLSLANNTRFEVSDLTIAKDHLKYKRQGSSEMSECDLADISLLKVSEGTYAGRYALYGGLVMGLVGARWALQFDNESANADAGDEWLLIGTFAASGVLFGGIVGYTQERWKTLYINEQSSLFRPSGIFLCFNPQGGQLRTGLRYEM